MSKFSHCASNVRKLSQRKFLCPHPRRLVLDQFRRVFQLHTSDSDSDSDNDSDETVVGDSDAPRFVYYVMCGNNEDPRKTADV